MSLSGFTGPFLFAICLFSSVSISETAVYRCSSAEGGVSFQHTRCAGEGSRVEVEVVETGWSGLRSGEVSLLETYRREEAQRRNRRTAVKAVVQPVQTRACWNKKKQLEKISRKLRRGYSAASSGPLRRKRDEYQAYLVRFCP